jgi:hypothetical protein
MVKFMKGALLAGVVSLALGSIASAQPLTDAEFKCQASQSKAAGKFVGSKTKCAQKCITNAGKALNPYSDCFAPYGGTALFCIGDVVKGAETKYGAAIVKACTKTAEDCPECYNNGDCSINGYAGDQVQNIEGQVDAFGPGVFCEQPGADAAETKCEQNTAKTLAKQVASINKCFDKCFANARKGIGTAAACTPNPTPSDPTLNTCISTASGKSIAGIDKKCSLVVPPAIPDCTATDDYPSGTFWVNLVNTAISGNIPATYCASPSGAFID